MRVLGIDLQKDFQGGILANVINCAAEQEGEITGEVPGITPSDTEGLNRIMAGVSD